MAFIILQLIGSIEWYRKTTYGIYLCMEYFFESRDRRTILGRVPLNFTNSTRFFHTFLLWNFNISSFKGFDLSYQLRNLHTKVFLLSDVAQFLDLTGCIFKRSIN
ncbi:hypothetical protein LguiA_025543 [Lonicera macranthoides]